MSITSCFKNLKNRVVTFLIVPPVHEDPYVNAILNTKVSKEEALNTCYLLFVDPIVRFAQERLRVVEEDVSVLYGIVEVDISLTVIDAVVVFNHSKRALLM